jgi:hypothetical protein
MCSHIEVRCRLVGERYLTSFLPDDAGIKGDLFIKEKAHEEYSPGFVRLKAIIVSRGSLFYLGQFVPGNGRKIVVFVMISYVKGYIVEYAIIAKRFLLFVVCQIMFLDPAGSQRVKSDREEEAEQEVNDCLGAEGHPDGGGENNLGEPVQCYPFIKGFDLAQSGDAEYLEYGVEQQPDHFTDEIIVDEFSLPAIGQVGIQFVYTLEGMVFDMVTFERDGAGEKLREIGQDAREAVSRSVLE